MPRLRYGDWRGALTALASGMDAPLWAVDALTALLSGDAREDTRSLGVLLDTIARVSASRDLETLLDYVVDSSVEATGAERGFLVLIDEKTGKQVVRVARSLDPGGEAKSIGRDSQYSTSVVKRVVDRQGPTPRIRALHPRCGRSWARTSPRAA